MSTAEDAQPALPPAGYYPDPHTQQPRWWDGQAWGPAAPKVTPAASPAQRKSRAWMVIALIAALIGIWTTGAFDHLLVNVGLNYNECYRNGFGATFCGDEADQYRQNVEDVTDTFSNP